MPVLAQRQTPTSCHTKLPDGSTPAQNRQKLIDQANAMNNMPKPFVRGPADLGYLGALGTWLANVSPGGSQDYKLSGQPGSEAQGNFNFGTTGTLFFGSTTLHSGAGIVQLLTLPSGSDGGIPFLVPPNGDAWDDYADIQAGIDAGC